MKIRSKQGGCKVGDAVITKAGNLPAQYVIHTVGPRWNGGKNNEESLLKQAYLSCFKIAEQYNISSIAFPNISTGIYRFPKDQAAKIALDTIKFCLDQNQNINKVYIICFDKQNYEIYKTMLD